MRKNAKSRILFIFACTAIASCMFAGPVHSAVGPGPKIYVFPYQPVLKGVPKDVTTQTTELLKNELKQSEDVRLQKGPVFIPEAVATEIKPLSNSELKAASALKKKGEAYYNKLRFDQAIKSFQGALSKYEKSLALLQDFTPVVDSLLMLSACYYRRDREDDGAKMLQRVIRLQPNIALNPQKYPPMFRNILENIRKKLLLKKRGELEIAANQEGAVVYLDGQKVGNTPVLLRELVPGEHYVRVEREGLQNWADKVNVVSTRRKKVLATLGGVKKATGPLGEIAESIRSNRLSKKVLKKLQTEGKKTGADYVIVGGVAKVSGDYRVGSFVFKLSNRTLCPLPEIKFDPDLLGAGVEVYNMASVLYKRVEDCPDPVKVKVVAVVQTIKRKPGQITAVAVGPAVPTAAVSSASVAMSPATPTRVATPSTRAPALPGTGPAVPASPAPVVTKAPATPPRVVTTSEGLATTGPGALQNAPARPIVVPLPYSEAVKPIDEQEDRGSKWYTSWWFWTVVGAVAVSGTVGGLVAGGVFDSGTTGASVTVQWPVP